MGFAFEISCCYLFEDPDEGIVYVTGVLKSPTADFLLRTMLTYEAGQFCQFFFELFDVLFGSHNTMSLCSW